MIYHKARRILNRDKWLISINRIPVHVFINRIACIPKFSRCFQESIKVMNYVKDHPNIKEFIYILLSFDEKE